MLVLFLSTFLIFIDRSFQRGRPVSQLMKEEGMPNSRVESKEPNIIMRPLAIGLPTFTVKCQLSDNEKVWKVQYVTYSIISGISIVVMYPKYRAPWKRTVPLQAVPPHANIISTF